MPTCTWLLLASLPVGVAVENASKDTDLALFSTSHSLFPETLSEWHFSVVLNSSDCHRALKSTYLWTSYLHILCM